MNLAISQNIYSGTLSNSKTRGIKKSTVRVFILSMLYACFIVFIPWQNIMKMEGFRDFNRQEFRYNNTTPDGSKIKVYKLNTVIKYFTMEVLWDEMMIRATSITGDAAITLRILSFFIAFTWAFLLFSKVPILWALPFLLNTTSIDVAMSGIRNGFAWSLVFIGLVSRSRLIKYFLFLVAPFFHSSSIVVLFFHLVNKISKHINFKKVGALIMAVLPGIAVALALTVLNQVVSNILGGDRRLGEGYARGGGSYLQMSFWIILFAIILTTHKDYINKYNFQINIIVWYLIMNPFVPWSYRVWGASMPLLTIAIWNLPKRIRSIVKYIWIGYTITWYLYWTKLFYLCYPS